MAVCAASERSKVYRPRNPRESPLWQCLSAHFYDFVQEYEEKYEATYGYFRPVIEDVINKFIDCGDLRKGFARAQCGECGGSFIIGFSCKCRYVCPTCHQKKALLFGESIMNEVVFPVPHRQHVFTIPKMLRLYFRNDRTLLGKLANVAKDCVLEFFRTILDLPDGKLGMVISIQTFGATLRTFHPHLHSLTADGLFRDSGTFYVLPKEVDTKPLEEMFRVNVIKMLVGEELLSQERAENLLSWKNSGFSVHLGEPIRPDQPLAIERTARYILRNTFSLEKMTYDEEAGTVIYRSDKIHPQTKRNFEIFTPGEFIAALTQHIPPRRAQMVRYMGWYSNRSRGRRRMDQEALLSPPDGIEIIDVSDFSPKKIPTKKWRELIAKVYEDPLLCPNCGNLMYIQSLTEDPVEIRGTLKDLGLWDKLVEDPPQARSPPRSHVSFLTLDLTESQLPLAEVFSN